MAKTKTQKELLASVRESTLAYNYDLTRVDTREYAAPLSVLFLSQIWKDIFIRRNKLFRAAMTGNAQAFKQIEQIDRKVGNLILQTMFQYCNDRQKEIEGKTVSLREYFEDFVRTPEQHEIYNDFALQVDSAIVLADILEIILSDAKELLAKLDPALILFEFDSIKAATKALADFTHIHHRDEHPDLQALFSDHAAATEEYIRMKTALYVKQYEDMRTSLINNNKIQPKSFKKQSDRQYITTLLANYFYNKNKDTPHELPKSAAFDKAESVMRQFTDSDLPELQPIILDLYKATETIHMAKEQMNTTIKNLQQTEVTDKIVHHIL